MVANKNVRILLEKKFSSYVFTRVTEDSEVTQEINSTGIIPLEALRAQPNKGLTFMVENPVWDLHLYRQETIFVLCDILHTCKEPR